MAVGKINEILDQLRQVSDSLPQDAAQRTARQIQSHERVFVQGAGRSGLMLRALAMRLAQMGRCAYVVGETTTPAIGEGEKVIVFLTDETAREKFGCHWNFIFVS